jgi:hypothetical protein
VVIGAVITQEDMVHIMEVDQYGQLAIHNVAVDHMELWVQKVDMVEMDIFLVVKIIQDDK